jgi:hypothetical protein
LEEVIVNYTRFVQIYFDDLIEELFSQDYFIYRENAIDYVQKFVFYINNSIHQLPHRKSPEALLKYGHFYIFYQSNPRTTWYIFFSKKKSTYLIKHISNNHNWDSSLINLL